MAGDEELLSVDDKDVFASALSDEPPAEQPEQQPSEEPKPEGERPRDEQGRFVPKDKEAETPAPATPLEPLKEQEPQRTPEDAIPSWRLREETQRRREAEERQAALEAQLRHFLQQAQRQQPPEQQPPDIIENPQAYAQYVRQQVLQEVRQIELVREQRAIKHSLEKADKTHGEEWKKAYEAFNAPHLRDDERLLEHVRNSYDPGEAILEWFRQSDPQAIRERVKKELLNDPEFVKEYGEALRSRATTRQPSNVTPLPNLTRAPGSSASMTEIEPMNDREMFDYARRR